MQAPCPDRGDSRRTSRTSRLKRKALVFGPLLAVVAVLVLALGVPLPVVAAALGLFVIWLLLEG